MWLVIELVRDIMSIQILIKFGDDWTKASKVIEQYPPHSSNSQANNERVNGRVIVWLGLNVDLYRI